MGTIGLTVLALGVCSRVFFPADAEVQLPNCDVTTRQLVKQNFQFADSDDDTEGKWQCVSLFDGTDDELATDENPLGYLHGQWQLDTHVTCRFIYPRGTQVKRKRENRVYSLTGYLNRKYTEARMPSQSSS